MPLLYCQLETLPPRTMCVHRDYTDLPAMDDNLDDANQAIELSCVQYVAEQRDNGRHSSHHLVVARAHNVDCHRPDLLSDNTVHGYRGISYLVKTVAV